MYYASVADVIALSRTPGANASTTITASVKATLLGYIRMISRRLDLDFGARRGLFTPYIETRKKALSSMQVNSLLNTFAFDDPLLELSALSIGGSSMTIGTDVVLYPDPDTPPFHALRLDTGLTWYGYPNSGDPVFVTLTGTWGLHRDYANAWMKVDDLAADITASQLTLTVADSDGENPYGESPRLSAGHLIRIGSEFLQVYKVDDGTNTLTTQRGMYGSTAAAHTSGDDVYVWRVEEPVKHVIARMAAFIWSRQGTYSTVEVQGMSEIRYPPDLLMEFRAVEQDYANGY